MQGISGQVDGGGRTGRWVATEPDAVERLAADVVGDRDRAAGHRLFGEKPHGAGGVGLGDDAAQPVGVLRPIEHSTGTIVDPGERMGLSLGQPHPDPVHMEFLSAESEPEIRPSILPAAEPGIGNLESHATPGVAAAGGDGLRVGAVVATGTVVLQSEHRAPAVVVIFHLDRHVSVGQLMREGIVHIEIHVTVGRGCLVLSANLATYGPYGGVAVGVGNACEGVGDVGCAEIHRGLGSDVRAVGQRGNRRKGVCIRALLQHHALEFVGKHHPPVARFALVVDEAAPFRMGWRRVIGHRHDVGGLIVFIPHTEEETVGGAGVDPIPALGPEKLAAVAVRVLGERSGRQLL